MMEPTATVAVSPTLAAMVLSPFAAVARTVLDGQTRSLSPLMCDSEVSGMTCMDNGTGHYFRLARDNCELH